MSVRWKVVGLLCFVCVSVCGAPNNSVNRKSALELLEDLKVTCSENPFLNNTSFSDDPMFAHCAKTTAKLKRADLYCLSFLDVNRRLCDFRSNAAFNWSERVRAAQSKELTADIVCDPASSITFSNLEEYPTYKKTIDLVFHNKIACLKLCLLENEDVIDVGVNNFCKVLYYGTTIIESVTKDNDAVRVPHGTPLKLMHSSIENGLTDSKMNENTVETKKNSEEQPIVKGNVQAKNSNGKIHLESSSIVGTQTIPIDNKLHQTTTTNQPMQQQQGETVLKSQEKQENVQYSIVNSNRRQEPSNPEEDVKQVETNELKPPTVDQEPKILEDEKLQNKLTNTVSNKIPVKDQNQDQNPDDIPALDDDNYDADDDVRMVNQGGAGIVSPQLKEEHISKPKAETNKQELQISVDKELAAAYTPLEYDEDDGSFVPLFFFGVFSMVLLYILYHNKNKIMGLMIEGRQGRRRNSRGHAYRRLDTLEQAMSSNPTTTPSKIIY